MIFSKQQKAFTIIELIVVVSIIAILTAIVVSNFAQSKAKSRDAKRLSDINQLQLAFELYFDRCNQYPILSSPLNAAADLTAVGQGCPTAINLKSFISKIPAAQSPGTYVYAVNDASIPTDYVLKTTLEIKNQALDDDIDGTVYSTDCADATFYYCAQPR